MKTYKTFSSRETMILGQEVASRILAKNTKANHAVVLALEGDLGAGKTTFVKGFFRGLGLKSKVTSPTFIIMRRTALKNAHFKNVYHIDAYRIHDPKEMAVLEFADIAKNSANIVLVEWADQIKSILPRSVARIIFSHGKNENERSISMSLLL